MEPRSTQKEVEPIAAQKKGWADVGPIDFT